MPLTIDDVKKAREWGITTHQPWKAQVKINDAIAAGQWEILWDDDTVDSSDPLVQNVYLNSIEDKVNTATSGAPSIFVPPPLGTKEDEGEKRAQKRKRVYQSYWDRSDMGRLRRKMFMDWFHTGAAFGIPWTEWFDANGDKLPPAARAPYLMRLDPRQAYPLAHDNQGKLIEVFFARQRRVAALEDEYGKNHPAFTSLARFRGSKKLDPSEFLEELWYFDSTYWAVAIGDSMLPREWQGRSLLPNGLIDQVGGSNLEFITEPELHGLDRCPVVELKRDTADDQYRGALEDIIPTLKTAQNFMARLLDDLNSNIYAPVVLDNIENWEEYGPAAVLRGTGDGPAQILRDRPPVNFEAQQVVQGLIGEAHREAAWPVQRSGDADASVVSAKGVVALAGSFNSELAWAQEDMERGLMELNKLAAAFDEKHCPGKKLIFGMEGIRSFHVRYDPTILFKGDYRNKVSYGDRTGLDESNKLTKLALLRNMGSISARTFAEKSGAVEDAIQEETEIALEKMVALFTDLLLPQQIEAGDLGALKDFVEKIDTDKETVRGAVMSTIRELESIVPGAAPGQGQGGAPDTIEMMRSLASGGIPGNAEGLPAPPSVGADLQRALPSQQRRLVSETAPGNTAA